ncbi:MAG: hypothetical protein MMC23_007682 [Stictis urceolatum]|nr:hypothetical protein [Stictis urceolata]
MKIALPWHREMINQRSIVVSPLNLTILFRVFVRLRDAGYPAHWISDSIYEFLSGQGITTTARPPRRLPLKIEDVRCEHPVKKLTVEPFVAEFGCLAAIFQPLLQMELVHMYIPEISSIYHYTFELKDSELWLRPDLSNLVLVFWDHGPFLDAAGGGAPHDLRPLLDPSWGEVSPQMGHPKVQHFREKGVAVWSTFEFDVGKKVVKVVMDKEFVDMCKRKRWWMGLWRTDMWCRAFTLPVEVRFAVQKGERWMSDDLEKAMPQLNLGKLA